MAEWLRSVIFSLMLLISDCTVRVHAPHRVHVGQPKFCLYSFLRVQTFSPHLPMSEIIVNH